MARHVCYSPRTQHWDDLSLSPPSQLRTPSSRKPGNIQQCAAPHPARISRNISAASCRDNLRRDRFNRTSAHAKAATFPLASTADYFRPAAACFTST
jgi:hypothetical protein